MQTEIDVIGGRYRLIDLIGKGGMGAVHTALDRLSGQKVALKRVLISPESLAFNSRGSDNLYLSLTQEFRTMASLRHPNINSVLDYGFDVERQPYFTMDLLQDPQSVFRAAWKSDEDKVALLIQVLQALAYLHRRGIIHRDLKPANILVVHDQVKVLDFGLSVTREQADHYELAGTLGYIAPELLLGDPPSEASDLYAMGVIGYEMFTGTSLFDADTTSSIIQATLKTIPKMDGIKNQKIGAVLARLLSKAPIDRYDDPTQVIAALCEAIDQPVPGESSAIRESFLQTARFVGRDNELKLLISALEDALMSKGSTWLISGESGSGKTRLLDELRTQALVQGVTVLRGQNVAEGAGLYQMWRVILRWLVLLAPLTNLQAGVLKTLVPDIDDLLERPIEDAPEVNPLFAQSRLQATIEAIFAQQKQPLLLILEDLHWAGRESLDLLRRMTHMAATLPLLIVGSFRDDERPDLANAIPQAKPLKLQRLAKDQIAELSAAMLGDEGRQPQLLELLQHETEGNVFFLVEVMRALAEQAGQLDRIAEMSLPGQVQARGINQIIRHRLERVPPENRSLLQTAAIIGRQLNLPWLERFVASPAELERWLTTCLNSAVLDVQDGVWQFAHDKLRDGVLADLPVEKRPMLHEQVAEAIEKGPGYDLSLLAYHWSMAGNTAKEAFYQERLGAQALKNGAYEKAVSSLDRAVTLQPSAPTPESFKQWANLKRMAADAHAGLGNYPVAERLYRESLDAYQAANYKWGVAAALNELGNLAFTQRDYAQANEQFRQALKTSMGVRAWTVALASVTGIAGLVAERGEREQAVELVTLVLNHLSVDQATTDRATRLLETIRTRLTPEVMAQAEARGKEARLSEVGAKLLENLQ